MNTVIHYRSSISIIFTVFIIGLFFPSILYAKEIPTSITIHTDQKDVEFEMQPEIIDGQIYLPLRDIAEQLGFTVDYNNREVVLSSGNDQVRHCIQTNTVSTETVLYIYMIPSVIKNDRVLMPLHMLSKTVQYDIQWDQEKSSLIGNQQTVQSTNNSGEKIQIFVKKPLLA